MAEKFLGKCFYPGKRTDLRRDISTFFHTNIESMYEVWERYKELLKKYPHHRLPKWIQVHNFYNTLNQNTRNMLNVAASGMLMNKSPWEGQQLLEEMATNAYQWPSERNEARRLAGVHHVDHMTHMSTNWSSK